MSNFEPPKAKVHAPQIAKQAMAAAKQQEPPQSARQAHSAQDWMKQQQSPKTADAKKKEDSAEKLRLDNERKKIREEGMKKWREKWNQREVGKNFADAPTPTPVVQQMAEVKTRNHIEQAKLKPVAQTASNWKNRDENENDVVVPSRQPFVQKKPELLLSRDILKEKSPQPLRISP
jgi:hypothetical protein